MAKANARVLQPALYNSARLRELPIPRAQRSIDEAVVDQVGATEEGNNNDGVMKLIMKLMKRMVRNKTSMYKMIQIRHFSIQPK